MRRAAHQVHKSFVVLKKKSVGSSIHSTDTDPSFALEETCCTLAEAETGFGDGI